MFPELTFLLSSQVSSVISQMIVQKVNGLQVICPLVKSEKVNIQRSAVALLGNLTKTPNLTNSIGMRKKKSRLLVVNINMVKHSAKMYLESAILI